MFKIISFTISLAFLVLGLLLGLFNPHSVNIDLIIFQAQLPLSLIIASSILLGLLIASIYFGSFTLRTKWALKKQLKENQKLNNTILDLNRKILEKENQDLLETKGKPLLLSKGL